MKIIIIVYEPYEYIGRTWVGNVYKYRWYVYAKDDRKTDISDSIYHKGKWVNVKKVFRGTKPEIKKWLKLKNYVYKGGWRK